MPWHAEARRLRDQGATYEKISEAVDRHINTVRRLLAPGAAEKQSAIWNRAYRQRYRTNVVFRERELQRCRAWRARQKEARS